MEWKEIKQWGDIFELKKFMDANPSFCQTHPDVRQEYESLRSKVLTGMKNHPEKYREHDLDMYYHFGIFTAEELIAKGILPTHTSENHYLPNLEQFYGHPYYEAKEGCTDIYLFGTPGTGKTCLLMGLTGADGKGYAINFRDKGGPYASALQQYVKAGRTPFATPDKFVTTIRSEIKEKRENKRTRKTVFVNHDVNFVEMSGGEFAYKIANNPNAEVKFVDMGDGTKELLRNSNRKVFFIIIDPTVDVIKFDYEREIANDSGDVIVVEHAIEYIDQIECINKFIALFDAEENKEFMKKVDAIHFIVTKADTLGDSDEERKEKARQLLIDRYRGPVEKLIHYCRRTKRVNYATDFHPMVYPFSLGRFFIDGSFEYDDSSTLKIINAIRYMTYGTKESSFLRRLFRLEAIKPKHGDCGLGIEVGDL